MWACIGRAPVLVLDQQNGISRKTSLPRAMKWYFSHYALLARRLKWYDEVIRGTKMQFEAPKCPHIRVYVLTVGLHERHVSTAWTISVVLGGNRRPTTGAGRYESTSKGQQRVQTCIEFIRN
jgi:hypothetical protein